MKELRAEITKEHLHLQKAVEAREVRNREPQTTIADQHATQSLLTELLNVLKDFYDKKAARQTSRPTRTMRRAALGNKNEI